MNRRSASSPTSRTASRPARRGAGLLRPAFLAFGGALAGALAQRADSFATWTGDLTSYLGLWIVAVAIVGFSAPTRRAAVSGASLFLAASVAGYYAAYAIDITAAPWLIVVVWLLAAVSVGPVVGAAGWLLRDGPPWSAVAAGALGGLLAAEAVAISGSVLVAIEHAPVAFDVAGALVALIAVARLSRDTRTGLLAAGAFGAGMALYLGSLWLFRSVL